MRLNQNNELKRCSKGTELQIWDMIRPDLSPRVSPFALHTVILYIVGINIVITRQIYKRWHQAPAAGDCKEKPSHVFGVKFGCHATSHLEGSHPQTPPHPLEIMSRVGSVASWGRVHVRVSKLKCSLLRNFYTQGDVFLRDNVAKSLTHARTC